MYEHGAIKAVIFTAFKVTKEEFLLIQAETQAFHFYQFGEETCPETGRHHLQGYGQTQWPIHKLCQKFKMWVRPMRGSPEENNRYTSKEGNVTRFGSYDPDVTPGSRSDLRAMMLLIQKGTTINQLWHSHPMNMLRYYRNFAEMRSQLAPPEDKRVVAREVINVYGPSGAGKTYWATEECKRRGLMYYNVACSDNTIWWPGYHNQPAVIINDFKCGIKYNTLVHLLDPWNNNEVHKRSGGETVLMTADLVIITSIEPIIKQYKETEKDTSELERRVTRGLLLPPRDLPQQISSKIDTSMGSEFQK